VRFAGAGGARGAAGGLPPGAGVGDGPHGAAEPSAAEPAVRQFLGAVCAVEQGVGQVAV
jgi:hypothetical protein